MTIDKTKRPFSDDRDRDFASRGIDTTIIGIEIARLMIANDPAAMVDPKLSEIARHFADAASSLAKASQCIKELR